VHAVRAKTYIQKRNCAVIHSFLTSALDGMGVVSFIPLQLEVRRTNPRYQINRKHVAETLIQAKHSVSTNIIYLWRR